MFDGQVYTDGVPVRKAAYASGGPAMGPAAGGLLRNAFVYSRMRSRGSLAHSYPRNLRIPTSQNYWAPMVANAGGAIVMVDRRYVAAHWTHAMLQVCFSILDDADTATFDLYGDDGVHLANTVELVLALSSGSEARVDQGDTLFEGRASSYEAIMQMPLGTVAATFAGAGQTGLSLPGLITFSLNAEATATSKDASPVTSPKVMILDSVSMWLECQEVTTP